MFEGDRRLKHPLPLAVNSTKENQFPALMHLLIRAVNQCGEGGLTALLCAGSKAAPPWLQHQAPAAAGQGFPAEILAGAWTWDPSIQWGDAVQCLTAGSRAWPLSTIHEGREPTGEYRVIPTGCELHFILLGWVWR